MFKWGGGGGGGGVCLYHDFVWMFHSLDSIVVRTCSLYSLLCSVLCA